MDGPYIPPHRRLAAAAAASAVAAGAAAANAPARLVAFNAATFSRPEPGDPGVVWGEYFIHSRGGNAALNTDVGTTSLFVRVVRSCTRHNNELHVSAGDDYKNNQLFALLSDGSLYSKYYPKPVRIGTTPAWLAEASVAGVVLEAAARRGAFFVDGECVHVFSWDGDLPRISLKVHRNGRLDVIPAPERCRVPALDAAVAVDGP